MRQVKRAVLALLLFVTACAPEGPPFGTISGGLPPVPTGMARIYVYRWLEPYEAVAQALVYLNAVPAGVTEVGATLYRDVAPGQYTIAVQSQGRYFNQFKTVTLAAGQIAYARVESLRAWSACGAERSGCYDTLVVEMVDPAVGLAEMRDLRFIRG